MASNDNQPDQIPPDAIAYLATAGEYLIKEQNVQFNNQQEFSDWYNENLIFIAAKAKELQFETWIKFLELENQQVQLNGIYNNFIHLNAKYLFMKILCERVYKTLNSNTHKS